MSPRCDRQTSLPVWRRSDAGTGARTTCIAGRSGDPVEGLSEASLEEVAAFPTCWVRHQ